MTIPILYLASLCSTMVTFLCWLWTRHPYTEEVCQKIVYHHLRIVRSIHLLNQLFYGLVLGNYLVIQEQSCWISLVTCLPVAFFFTSFWIILNKKIKLVKGRLGS